MLDIDQLTQFSLNSDRKPLVEWGGLEPGEKAIREDDVAVGLVTGERSGVFVLDWDDTTKELPEGWDIPDTYSRKTRRGYHFYFEVPEGIRIPNTTKFPSEGWDIRGDGGMVVFLAEGYEDVVDVPPAPCPPWLLECIADYELKRLQKEIADHVSVDLSTDFGQKMLRAATNDARQMDVGGPGERDGKLFRAAVQLVRGRGMSVETAAALLDSHYAPRVSEDGRDTVSSVRVRYKCLEAAQVGVYDLQPFDSTDISKWVNWSRPVLEAERRKRYNLVKPEDIQRPVSTEDYRPQVSKDMVPAVELKKIDFPNLVNILATHEDWVNRLYFDAFSQEYKVLEPPVSMENKGFFSRDDVSAVRQWQGCALSLNASKDMVEDSLSKAARDNEIHPVKEYLSSLSGEVQEPEIMLEDFACIGLGVTDPIVVRYVKKFMIGAVRRILEPGIKMDNVLVLKGPQGVGKSSLLYALCPEPAWVQESLPALDSKDASEAVRGKWLVEIAELQAMLKKDEATAKDFLSRQVDSYRRPYERGTTRHPRECVFIATTNDDRFLRDSTGARRYLIVETENIDTNWVKENRDLIWSAALCLALTDTPHHLTQDETKEMEEIQKQFQAEDPWHPQIEKYLANKTKIENVQEVYLFALHDPAGLLSDTIRATHIKSFDRQAQHRVADTMRRLGWDRRKGKARGWYKRGYEEQTSSTAISGTSRSSGAA